MLPVLRPGTYTLSVEAAGFSKSVVTGIELAVSANVSQDVTLDVGKVNETVEVTANAVAVTTADAQVSSAVTMTDIDNLPQLGRAPIALSYFQPGVAISQNGSNAGADYTYSHINGMRQCSNNNTLDGIDVNDAVAPRLGLSMTANNTDSVEEFRVVTEGGKAERLAAATPGAIFINQFANPANPLAHQTGTGPEIFAQLEGKVDAIVCGVGSGGTLPGLSRFFAERSPATEIILADPTGSILKDVVEKRPPGDAGSWLVEGIGEDFVPVNADLSRGSCAYAVSDAESFAAARELLKRYTRVIAVRVWVASVVQGLPETVGIHRG